jgi:ABC-type nitrate/sulfonate/bicarbonate transport system ATPase subunit
MASLIGGPVTGYIGDVIIVDRVALQVLPGTVTVLFAPSGAGKSSFLRMIAGLWDGRVTGLRVDSNLRVGYVAQRDFLFPWMTLGQNIEFPAKIIKLPPVSRRKKLEDLSTLFKIGGILGRFPYQVSGGELQRALIVRGLVAGANLLLLDEPMNSLDVASRIALRESLQAAVSVSKVALMLVTHELADAISMADTICLFSGPPLRLRNVLSRASPRSFAENGRARTIEETRLWIEEEFAKMGTTESHYSPTLF